MLAKTHGQPASPTNLAKEFKVRRPSNAREIMSRIGKRTGKRWTKRWTTDNWTVLLEETGNPRFTAIPMTDPSGAAIYGAPWIPSIYPLNYVSIFLPAPWIRHGICRVGWAAGGFTFPICFALGVLLNAHFAEPIADKFKTIGLSKNRVYWNQKMLIFNRKIVMSTHFLDFSGTLLLNRWKLEGAQVRRVLTFQVFLERIESQLKLLKQVPHHGELELQKKRG